MIFNGNLEWESEKTERIISIFFKAYNPAFQREISCRGALIFYVLRKKNFSSGDGAKPT